MCLWVAAKVAPQRELVVAKRLEALGCVIYLPRARVRLKRSLRPVTVPLYATYLFADVDQGPTWQRINRTPGVLSILMTGDIPSRCPEIEIAKLKAAEIDGVVQLANEPPPLSAQKFTEGEAVRIKLGAFENRPARYSKPARKNMSIVMVMLLNRVVTVQVPALVQTLEVEPSRGLEVTADHVARTAFQISGPVLS